MIESLAITVRNDHSKSWNNIFCLSKATTLNQTIIYNTYNNSNLSPQLINFLNNDYIFDGLAGQYRSVQGVNQTASPAGLEAGLLCGLKIVIFKAKIQKINIYIQPLWPNRKILSRGQIGSKNCYGTWGGGRGGEKYS